MNFKKINSKDGSALVVVLWVLGILSMFVLAFAFEMHLQSRIVSSWRKRIKADYLARAGIELARMALLETDDPDINNTDKSIYLSKGADQQVRSAALALSDGASAQINRKLGDGLITVSIKPENSAMNFNSMIYPKDRQLTYDTWNPFFKQINVPREKRDKLVDCLIDWVDKNELTHLNGAETEYYQTLQPPYEAKNAKFDTIDELMLVKYFNELLPETSQTVYQALSPFLTTYSKTQKININAASANIIEAFFDMDHMIAEAIVEERLGPDEQPGTEDDEPYTDLNDLLLRIPVLDKSISDYITFGSEGIFGIISSAQIKDITFSIRCVVSLSKNKLTFLKWEENPE
jgi:general secretion pathway protein K